MSVCIQADEDSGAEEPGAPVRDMYEHKAESKAVRVLTVLAYLLLVSLGAILLSVYYVCFWQPTHLVNSTNTSAIQARRATDTFDSSVEPTAGRNKSTVSDEVPAATPTNIISLPDGGGGGGGGPRDSKIPADSKSPSTTSRTPKTTDAIGAARTTNDGITTITT